MQYIPNSAYFIGGILRTVHPLLFDVGSDPAERYPVNVTSQPEVMQAILEAAQRNRESIKWTQPLCAKTDPELWPCVNRTRSCRTYDRETPL